MQNEKFKKIITIAVACIAAVVAVTAFNTFKKAKDTTSDGKIAKLDSATRALSDRLDEQESATSAQQVGIDSATLALSGRLDEQGSAILEQQSAINALTAYNRDFVTADTSTKYHLFDRECGTFKIVALRSGDNYIDFYDSTDTKIGSITWNLSKNDVLFVTFSENGARASMINIHSGSNPETKDYVASSTETLSYFKLANSREVLISIQ